MSKKLIIIEHNLMQASKTDDITLNNFLKIEI